MVSILELVTVIVQKWNKRLHFRPDICHINRPRAYKQEPEHEYLVWLNETIVMFFSLNVKKSLSNDHVGRSTENN